MKITVNDVEYFENVWTRMGDEDSEPSEDKCYLGAWVDMEGCYSDPIRIYWVEDEISFFACDWNLPFPLRVDVYMEIPEIRVRA